MAAAVPYGYANPPRPVGGYGNYGNPQQNPALLAAMINAQNPWGPRQRLERCPLLLVAPGHPLGKVAATEAFL